MAQWLGEVFGGPTGYSDTQGGHGHMVAKHFGRGITEPQRRRWVGLIQDAADEAGLPTDAEFPRDALVHELPARGRQALVAGVAVE